MFWTGDIKYKILYKKQKNFIVNLNRKAKQTYFQNLGTGSKDFWIACKPFFSNRFLQREKITLLDSNSILMTDDSVVASIFNSFFINISQNLNIKPWETSPAQVETNLESLDDIDVMLRNFADHPSIRGILSMGKSSNVHSFSFSHVEPLTVYRAILKLNPRKSVSGSIPTKVLQLIAEIICVPLTDCINASICNGIFPDVLKLAEVSPVFKKGDKFLKENYRPISILPSFSKIYERILYDQITVYFNKIFSDHLCGFRQKYSTQHALLHMLNQWHQCRDKSGIVGTILMDLSKAFDTLDHDLLLAKLSAYGVEKNSLRLLKSYLTNRYQRTRVGSSFSEWLEIILGVPQGSILGPLLFNIFINDLLKIVEKTSICNFADDNTIFSCGNTVENVMSNLQDDLVKVLSWFSSNHLVANPEKFQMMFLGCKNDGLTMKVGNITIKSSDSVKLLGVTLDNKLSFDKHIADLCKRASYSIRCLYRIRDYIDTNQSKLLFSSFIQSNFIYAPIIWMFCGKSSSQAINSIYKRALRAISGHFHDSLEDLLKETGLISAHEFHLRLLLCEIYKTIHCINPIFMQNIFYPKEVLYELRISNLLHLPRAKSVIHGTSCFAFRGRLLWNQLPDTLKTAPSLTAFKKALVTYKIQGICKCSTCK